MSIINIDTEHIIDLPSLYLELDGGINTFTSKRQCHINGLHLIKFS
jgi:hypothetical protein